MISNREEKGREGIWRVGWCLSVRRLINNNTRLGWHLLPMCVIVYAHPDRKAVFSDQPSGPPGADSFRLITSFDSVHRWKTLRAKPSHLSFTLSFYSTYFRRYSPKDFNIPLDITVIPEKFLLTVFIRYFCDCLYDACFNNSFQILIQD